MAEFRLEHTDDRPDGVDASAPGPAAPAHRQSEGFDDSEPKRNLAIEGTALFEHSAQVDQIFGALAQAQGEIVQPLKTKKAIVTGTKNNRDYSYVYWYCDISDVLNACLGPFSKAGIAQMQFPTIEEVEILVGEGTKTRPAAMVHVRTVLGHKSGQWISCTLRAVADSMGPQALGSVITYLRRYGLQLVGGIAADEDEDGGQGQGNQSGGAGANQGSVNPQDPQRTNDEKAVWEHVGRVLDYQPKPVGGGKVKHNIKIQGVEKWVSTVDKVLGEKIGREKGTGCEVRVQLKAVGQYVDLIGGALVPPAGAAVG